MQKLSQEQRSILELQLKRTRDVHERNRLCVILARDEGHSPDVIANILRLSRESVFGYLRDYENEGKTQHDPKGGRQCKLSTEQLSQLLDHLAKNTYKKAASICAYIQKTFSVNYSAKGLIHLLQKHGFTYKKPLKVPTRLSPEKQQAFIQAYHDLKAELGSDEEIYFMDAVHPEYQSQAAFGWIKKGIRKTLQTTAKQERLHFIGALRLNGMGIVTEEYQTIGQEEVIDFLKKLEEKSIASKIYIILDNARSNRNKALEAYLKGSKICLHYLPPYSPNLNPIERLWKIMRENTTYNTYYEKFESFTTSIRGFFENLAMFTDILTTRINDNFQKITLDPVQFSK